MTTLPSSRSIAQHEAHHASALCIQGMVPECVRTDYPSATEFGRVTIDWGDRVTRDKATRVLVAIFLGATTEGFEGWDWPIDVDRVPTGARYDAERARYLAHTYLKLGPVDWSYVRWQASQIARDQKFRRLVVAIADELEWREVLYADDLRKLMEETRCNT
jgi:hypothetical protein